MRQVMFKEDGIMGIILCYTKQRPLFALFLQHSAQYSESNSSKTTNSKYVPTSQHVRQIYTPTFSSLLTPSLYSYLHSPSDPFIFLFYTSARSLIFPPTCSSDSPHNTRSSAFPLKISILFSLVLFSIWSSPH